MEAHLVRPVELEGGNSLVHELLEVLEPRLPSLRDSVLVPGREVRVLDDVILVRLVSLGSGRLTAGSQEALLVLAQVVVATQPQAEFEPHVPHRRHEGGVVLAFEPERGVEPLLTPALLDREIVVLVHPVRLQADEVARDSLAAELIGLVEDVAGAHTALVTHEGEAVGPHGQQVRSTRDLGVAVQDERQGLARDQVVVELPAP